MLYINENIPSFKLLYFLQIQNGNMLQNKVKIKIDKIKIGI